MGWILFHNHKTQIYTLLNFPFLWVRDTQSIIYVSLRFQWSKDSFSILHVKWIQEKIGPLRQTRIPCRWNSCRGPLIEKTSFKFPIADLISRYLYKSYIISLIHIFVVQYEKTYSYTAKISFSLLSLPCILILFALGCLEVTFYKWNEKREREREKERAELGREKKKENGFKWNAVIIQL